jgi:hypothetical protein
MWQHAVRAIKAACSRYPHLAHVAPRCDDGLPGRQEHRMKTSLVVALLALLLGACGSAQREPTEKDKALLRAIEAPQDKARALEGQLQQDQQRKRDAVEASEG